MILYFGCAILFCVGVWGVLAKRNALKVAIALCIVEYSIFLFFALIGYQEGGAAPIETPDGAAPAFVDPLPQAVVLTAIVIGLAVTALLVSTAVRIFHTHKTLDLRSIRKLRE